MQAKAMELAGKMQKMAGDPAKMQDLAGKLQEIQKNVQESGANGSYTIQEACEAYDELLEAVG
ncbi:MAG: hypothetical protein Pars2KO_13450 [Parasphingorhabdus sp.]